MSFPNSPTNNQRAIINDIIYIYESATNSWNKVKATTANIVVTNNARVVSNTVSTSTTTGALRVTGGVGVTGNVVAGAVYTNSYFYANGAAYANSGFVGSAGFTGSAGSAGTNGFTGSAGTNGFTGSAGAGYTGSSGASITALYSRSVITATAGQTVFAVAYNANYLQVFFNGALLNSSDYTAINGTTVTLTDAAAADDLLEFVTYEPVSITQTPVATINSTNLTANLTIAAGYSAVSVGPINIASNVTVSVASGQKWVIL